MPIAATIETELNAERSSSQDSSAGGGHQPTAGRWAQQKSSNTVLSSGDRA